MGVRSVFPYEAIFFGLLGIRNVGSRGVRSEHKTNYGTRPPHESKVDAFDHGRNSPPCAYNARSQAARKTSTRNQALRVC